MIPRHTIFLDAQDIEEYITNGRLNHIYSILVSISELVNQAEKAILRQPRQDEIPPEQTPDRNSLQEIPDKSEDPAAPRTQKVTTEILHQLLREAGMGRNGADYNITDEARLIHYLSGFSPNTIRRYLTSGNLTPSQGGEVRSAMKLLRLLNTEITIK